VAKRNKIWANFDWITFGLYLLLVVLGWINIYAAVFNEEHQSILDTTQRYGKQLLWIGFGIVLSLLILNIDSKFFVSFAYLFYALTIFLLFAVLFLGKEVNGARSWFELGSIRLQPAEFAKFATNLALAKYLGQYNFKLKGFKNYLRIGVILFTPVFLIVLQNDAGSALVYFVFVLVLFREGLPGVWLLLGFSFAAIFILSLLWPPLKLRIFLLVVALTVFALNGKRWNLVIRAIVLPVLSFGLFSLLNFGFKLELIMEKIVLYSILFSSIIFLFYTLINRLSAGTWTVLILLGALMFDSTVDYAFESVLEPHQQVRINELLGISSDPLGAGYNVNQSKIAIGSGGITGKGFLKGTQTKFNFVPEQSTDFIFCTVGEEWGFVGTSFIIFLFIVLLLRLIFLAERQRSVFSRVYGYGVASILFFHVAVNIAMTIGLGPVIGIPLPFFSYGGSSLWSFTILLFIFLRLDVSRMEVLR